MDQGNFYNPVWDVHTSEVPTHSTLDAETSCWVSYMSFFAEQTNIPLSFSYHRIQILPLTPVLNTLCHYDLPNSKKDITELEKTLRKAARMMKGMDQLYKSSTIRDTNAKMQKQPPAQGVLKSLLPASWEGLLCTHAVCALFLWTTGRCRRRVLPDF